MFDWKPGKDSYRKLREKVFTDSVLERIGISPEEYNRIRIFDRVTSLKIVQHLSISSDELAKANIDFDPETLQKEFGTI